MKQEQKKHLSMRTLRSKVQELGQAMFSLHDAKALRSILSRYGWQMLSIASSRSRVTSRVRKLFALSDFLMKMTRHHGENFTIQWLKSCTVAIQRAIAKDPAKSLREICPGLPLPRLTTSGFPVVISPVDRRKMILGDIQTIRVWMSIFSLYRVIKMNITQGKIESITGPFTGSDATVQLFKTFVENHALSFLKRHKAAPERIMLAPVMESPYLSRSAGPNVSMAIAGILVDARAWNISCQDHLLQSYLKLVGGMKVWEHYLDLVRLETQVSGITTSRVMKLDAMMTGPRLGQLSTKEEAAGKLRIFAITDYWTQWALKPLHTAIFRILKSLPTDGTFDQDAAVSRIAKIAVEKQVAFSFDLSSATDRVPVLIQSYILDAVFGKPGLGRAWKDLLTTRSWHVPTKAQKAYNLPSSVKYEVGQPMGALSSWAMLALTHHLMVQCAASFLGYHPGEFQAYVVLGDDIVICDHMVALAYEDLVTNLGVGINRAKTLRSKPGSSLICLEFAKRFIVNGKDASPISMKQLVSATTLAARVQNLLYYGFKGLVTGFASFGVILARYATDAKRPIHLHMKTKGFMHGLVGSLGALYRKGYITLEMLVEACANPEDPDFDFSEKESFSVPSAQVMTLLRKAFAYKEGDEGFGYPFSSQEEREEYRTDLVLAKDLHLIALSALKVLADSYDNIVDSFARLLANGMGKGAERDAFDNLLREDRVAAAQLRSVAEWLLVGSKDPEEIYENLLEKCDNAHFNPTLAEGMSVSEESMVYIASFSLTPTPKRAKAEDEAWISLRLLRSGWPGVKYWENPTCSPWSGWPPEERTP